MKCEVARYSRRSMEKRSNEPQFDVHGDYSLYMGESANADSCSLSPCTTCALFSSWETRSQMLSGYGN
jgi:hypothetical protein